ncbi:MAG: alpha-mannosidase [Clostridia bacterium]|nr:alpha-mannosidase [Clostridia bacterium]
MSKKLHLICNAHLDPVWQWEWEEGAAEALSTFRIAADFCEEYENFVFCHNEALLYQWIETYDKALFARIRRLVKEGKWHIMGGWHLQPDCNMPAGELLLRQITSGRTYFKEKFGVVPTVAVNVDPFGHTRGLVQLLYKTGYTGYLFMRPSSNNGDFGLPADDFTWVGYDGNTVAATRLRYGYGSDKGKAADKIRRMIAGCPDGEVALCLWGVGNHGGGPSKRDLDEIGALADTAANEGVTVIHSTPEQYFAEMKEKRTLPRVEKSLNPWAVGCYTSQSRIKQAYRKAENDYLMTEAMCTHAESAGLLAYPERELCEALYDILTVQFHDILPGTSVQSAEAMALRMLGHASEILSRLRAQAFFALSAGQKKACEDKIPVLAYNPYPYPIESDLTCEMMLWDQYRDVTFMQPQIYDACGNALPTQCEKENSTIPIEWRKRVVFRAKLAPMSMNRFDCAFTALDARPTYTCPETETYFTFDTARMHVAVNRKTGLVDRFCRDGVEYLREGAMALEVWDDNFDPWYMNRNRWTEKCGDFTLLSPTQTAAYYAVPAPIPAVRVIESGAVRTVIEAAFGYGDSRASVQYILSNHDTFEIKVHIDWHEKNKVLKLNVASFMENAECIGDQVFGRERMAGGLTENVSQKYIALCDREHALLVANDGTYGSSFDETASSLKLTLLRSPSYTAHPVGDRPVMPTDRYMPYIDQGEHDFAFLLEAGERKHVMANAARLAQHFGTRPMLLSLYPSGEGECAACPVTLDESAPVTLQAFKKADDGKGYVVRLFNPTERPQKSKLAVLGKTQLLLFGAFEVKTCYFGELGYMELDPMEWGVAKFR